MLPHEFVTLLPSGNVIFEIPLCSSEDTHEICIPPSSAESTVKSKFGLILSIFVTWCSTKIPFPILSYAKNI